MPIYNPALAGSVVETEPTHITGYTLTGRMTMWAWTADGSGNVTWKSGHWFRGEISRVVLDPRSAGAATVNLKVNDIHGLDLLGGAASAASNVNNTQWPALGTVDHKQVIDGYLWLVMSGLNAGENGTAYVYEF